MSYHERNIAMGNGYAEMMLEQDKVFKWIATLSPEDEQKLDRLLDERKQKHAADTGATLSRPVARTSLTLDEMKVLLAQK